MIKKELPKTFDPSIVEEKWYLFWEEKGYFKPQESATKSPYTITWGTLL
jgi:valyl-tRNA synthetase